MAGYFLPPDMDMGLASISPICGCSGQCQYCYLDLKDYSAAQINACGLEQMLSLLNENTGFIAGRDGTVVCIGSWGEVFPAVKQLREESFRWIKELLKLKNPMVIVTKTLISDEEAQLLHDFMQYTGQLLVMETITTITRACDVEPGCCRPEKRFRSLMNCAGQGIGVGVLINPYLKGITDTDMKEILAETSRCGVKNIVISPLFINDVLLKKMLRSNSLGPLAIRFANANNSRARGMKTGAGNVLADDITQLQPQLRQLTGLYGIQCHFHYLCVISQFFFRANKVFYKNPKICVNCGHCTKFI